MCMCDARHFFLMARVFVLQYSRTYTLYQLPWLSDVVMYLSVIMMYTVIMYMIVPYFSGRNIGRERDANAHTICSILDNATYSVLAPSTHLSGWCRIIRHEWRQQVHVLVTAMPMYSYCWCDWVFTLCSCYVNMAVPVCPYNVRAWFLLCLCHSTEVFAPYSSTVLVMLMFCHSGVVPL